MSKLLSGTLEQAGRAAAVSQCTPEEVTCRLGRSARAVEVPAPTGASVGRFPVVRELGRGGMGVVLLAHDLDLDRPVALKILRADDPQTLARFRLEANALAGLTHPNVVRVYQLGDDAGQLYLVMEYVEGRSLDHALRDGPLDPRRAARLVALAAAAVHAAHEAGIVHRDIKPANVLLDHADNPKITDFGIARRLNAPGLTEANAVIGSPAYMAPEQTAGRPADARTDVYGLGATLYECLTGRPPFVGPVLELLKQVADDEPVPPRRFNRSIPPDLETVCLKCLAQEPARRYATAADLAADLERFIRGEAVRARPVSWSERAWRWCRRNRLAASLAIVAVTGARRRDGGGRGSGVSGNGRPRRRGPRAAGGRNRTGQSPGR